MMIPDLPKNEQDALSGMKASERAQYMAILEMKYAVLRLCDEIRLDRRANGQAAQALKEVAQDKKDNKRLAKVLRLEK